MKKMKNIKKINNFFINVDLFKCFHKAALIRFTDLLMHEKIHAKLFRIVNIKKTKIYVKFNKNKGFFYGFCEPLDQINVLLTFPIDFIHSIFDILYDLFHFQFKNIFWHIIESCKDFKKDLKKIKNS